MNLSNCARFLVEFVGLLNYFFFCNYVGSNEIKFPDKYLLSAAGPKCNAFRLLRALQLPKPILLEGTPWVGKTSLVMALGQASGHNVVRINLSEQTVSYCLAKKF